MNCSVCRFRKEVIIGSGVCSEACLNFKHHKENVDFAIKVSVERSLFDLRHAYKAKCVILRFELEEVEARLTLLTKLQMLSLLLIQNVGVVETVLIKIALMKEEEANLRRLKISLSSKLEEVQGMMF